jgi:hypothetical protein
MGLMRRLFELRPWYKLVPDQSVLATDPGKGSEQILAARADDGSFIIAYLPMAYAVTIHMDKVSGKNGKARWYDPRQGTWSEIGQYANKGAREFTPPSAEARNDWVLVIDDADKGYPTSQAK